MEYYVQITLQRLPYYVYRHAIESLLVRIHGALKEHGEGQVGVSFSGYHKAPIGGKSHLGDSITLVSESREHLTNVRKNLDVTGILDIDAIDIDFIKPVPEGAQRAVFKRRRNEEKRCSEANVMNADRTYPFFTYKARGSKRQYMIRIEKREGEGRDGEFNSFGLSATRSVPIVA